MTVWRSFGQELVGARAQGVQAEDIGLLGGVGIVGHELEQEAVELGLGEVVRPLGLDRVLRGEDQERPGDRVRGAVDGHPVFLHDLEEAEWVLAGARLISSARRSWVKTGPGRNRKSWVRSS